MAHTFKVAFSTFRHPGKEPLYYRAITQIASSNFEKKSLASISLSQEEDISTALHWKYDSDHLPTLAYVLGLRAGTFNILNSAFLHHVVRDCWKNSYFMNQEKMTSKSYPELSMREEQCYLSIKDLMLNGTNSLDILCIQECSDKMFRFLQKEFLKLRASNELQLFMTDGGLGNHVVMIVKPSSTIKVTKSFGSALWNRKFVPPATKTLENPNGVTQFDLDIWRPAQIIKLELTTPLGKSIEVVFAGVHISCAGEPDEYRKARANELANGINKLVRTNENVLLLGDFNMSSCVINQSDLNTFSQLALDYGHVDAKEKKIMAIDQILFRTLQPGINKFCGHLPLKDSPALQAAEVYETAITPIVLSKRS